MNGLVGVVGAGSRGLLAARLFLDYGYRVLLHDPDPGLLDEGARLLAPPGPKGAGSGASARARGSIRPAASLLELRDSGLVLVEAECGSTQGRALLSALDALLAPGAVLAVGPSVPGAETASQRLLRRERVLGMHFLSPPLDPKLVELARASRTGEEAFRGAWELALSIERLPVEVKDGPGLLIDRLTRAFGIEAQRAAAEGWGSFAAVDAAVRAVGGLPWGPFEFMDLAGLDEDLLLSRAVHRALGSPARLAPGEFEEKLVALGHTGRRASRGFYRYDAGGAAGENPEADALLPLSSRIQPPQALSRRVLRAMAEEARLACAQGLAPRDVVNMAVRTAFQAARGPFEWRLS